jgi:hypothetical protein
MFVSKKIQLTSWYSPPPLRSWQLLSWSSQVKVGVTLQLTVSQSVSKSWCRALSGAHDQIFITVWQLRFCFCGVPSLTRALGLSFVHVASPCQHSLSQVLVPWYSRPYFTVSDMRLPFSSPPTTRRVTVEVFDPASRVFINSLLLVSILSGQIKSTFLDFVCSNFPERLLYTETTLT